MALSQDVEKAMQREHAATKLFDSPVSCSPVKKNGHHVDVVHRVGHNRMLALVFSGHLALESHQRRRLRRLWLEHGGPASNRLEERFCLFDPRLRVLRSQRH